MSEKQTPVLEQQRSNEPLEEARFADLLSAVGNHEGKALLLLAMRPGEYYGQYELHGLLRDLPGAEDAFIGNATNQVSYCKDSLGPIGAVAKEEHGATLKYGLSDFGATYGKALATTLLEFSLERGVRLENIFGTTRSRTTTRAPYSRMMIMQALVTAPEAETYANLASSLGLHVAAVTQHLARLATVDLVEVSRWDYAKDEVSYSLVKEYLPSVTGRPPMPSTRLAMEYLNTHKSAGLHEIVDYCMTNMSEAELRDLTRSKLTQKLSIALHQMSRKGTIERSGYSHDIHADRRIASASLTERQHEFWEDLLNRLESIRNATDEQLAEINERGKLLLKNPGTAGALLNTAYEHLDKGDGTGRDIGAYVLKALTSATAPLTARDIFEQSNGENFRYSLWGIRKTLGKLSAQGVVSAPDTKIKTYALTEITSKD